MKLRIIGHTRFAQYQGKEFPLLCQKNQNLLISNDPNDIAIGFSKDETPWHKVYELSVSSDQVESAYRVQTWAKYKGYDFFIFGYKEEDNTVALEPDLSISNYTLDLLFGQHRVSPHETFAPWVKIGDLEEIWELRSPVEGFNYVGPEKVYLKEKKL